MNSRLLLIIKNTIEKEWRSKALIFLMILTIISLFIVGGVVTLMKETFTVSSGMDVVGGQAMNIFFWVVNLWNVFLSVYFGISTITTDRESGVVVQLMSFPITRFEYLVGRILGCWCVVFFYYTVATLLGMSGLSVSAGEWIGGIPMLWAFFLSSITWLIAITIAIFIANFMGKLAAFITMFFVNLMMWSSFTYFNNNDMLEMLKTFSITKYIGAVIYSVTPHVSYWSSMVNEKLFQVESGKGISLFESLHLVGAYALLLLVLWQVFRKKEL
jgi:ABC-type transport system involved in multi-copper enzyme maturation permease subunit